MNALQGILWGLVVVSALVQIAQVQGHRDLLQEWQTADKQRYLLLQEHTRLVLEKSTLMANGRVDQLARKQLNMKDPEQVQVLSE